jgi:hypothetical protein
MIDKTNKLQRKSFLPQMHTGASIQPKPEGDPSVLIESWTERLRGFWEDSLSGELDWRTLSFGESRALFDFGIDQLLPPNGPTGFRYADAVPDLVGDGLAKGTPNRLTWGELAATYGATLFLAYDGKMKPRVLVRADLVAAAALNYHAEDMAQCPFAPRNSKGSQPKKQVTNVYRGTKKPAGRARDWKGKIGRSLQCASGIR